MNSANYAETRLAELFGGIMTPASDLVVPDQTVQVYGEDFDIVKFMKESADPDTGMLRDLKLDDRELANAKNYYDFAHVIIGKDAHPPWLIQMWTGLLLFGEVCTACTPKKWLNLSWIVDNIDKRMPSVEITEHMQLLEYGSCPKCGRHKWDLIKNHGLNNYVELVNVLGQRSGKSASAASYTAYHKHRYLKFPRLADLTSAMQKSTELTGTMVSLNFDKAFSLLWTPLMNIVNESSWFCLAEGTPVLLADGTEKPIQELVPGEMVKTLGDDQPVVDLFDNGVRECFEIELADGRTIVATEDHKFYVLRNGKPEWVMLKDIVEGDEIVSV